MNIDFNTALNNAESAIKTFVDGEHTYAANLEKAAYNIVCKLVELQKAAENHPKEYDAFLVEREVKVTKKTGNPYHATMRALVPTNIRHEYRQRITYYAQVAYVLNDRKVADVHSWFAEPEEVGNVVLTGLSKAVAIYKAMPEVIARNEARRNGPKPGTTANGVPAVAIGYVTKSKRFVATKVFTQTDIVEAASAIFGKSNQILCLPAPEPKAEAANENQADQAA